MVAESIHGHEVIHLIQESEQGWQREELLASIEARFGAEAKFHTCSAEGMDARQLLAFLEARGKFQPGASIRMDASKVCNH